MDIQLLSIIFHRIGIIILITVTGVMIMLPNIFFHSDDIIFGKKTAYFLHVIGKFAIILLVITGLIRLSFDVPSLFFIKVPLVLLVIYLYFIISRNYETEEYNHYQKLNVIRLLSVLITGLVGLYL